MVFSNEGREKAIAIWRNPALQLEGFEFKQCCTPNSTLQL
jgi:hypothetical protein